MPLSGTYEWTETADTVVLTVPLGGSSPKTVDVYVSETVIKVSYPPYLLDLDLARSVDDDASTAVLREGVLTLNLGKAERGVRWGKLLFEGGASEREERRSRAARNREARVGRRHELAKKKRREEERMTLRKQMDLERWERRRIEELKEEERRSAEDEVYRCIEEMRRRPVRSGRSRDEENAPTAADAGDGATPVGDGSMTGDSDPAGGTGWEGSRPAPNGPSDQIFPSEEIEHETAEGDDGNRPPEKNGDIPAPRRPMRATFRHTPRIFKTPRRESTVGREEEFITKNGPRLANNALLNRDGLDVSHSDPAWLRGRGDGYYRSGDYRSAINAYTASLEADGYDVRALSNRAACYLRLACEVRGGGGGEEFAERCARDCRDALGMDGAIRHHFPGDGDGPRRFRRKLLVREGAARSRMGDYSSAISCYERAGDMMSADDDDDDGAFARDLERLRVLREASESKGRGDDLFESGDLDGALEAYGESLSADPTFVGALSNRSACHLAAGNMRDCVKDCGSALDVLSSDRDQDRGTRASASAYAPPPGSDETRTLIAALLCRRGAANARMGDRTGAVEDMRTASELLGTDDEAAADAIRRDIEALETERC